jgi:hypothetical protein
MPQSSKIKSIVKDTANLLNGKYDETVDGVPRIIISGTYNTFSIVYVARSGEWKVFYPFPADVDKQKKIYFKFTEDLKTYLESQGVVCE